MSRVVRPNFLIVSLDKTRREVKWLWRVPNVLVSPGCLRGAHHKLSGQCGIDTTDVDSVMAGDDKIKAWDSMQKLVGSSASIFLSGGSMLAWPSVTSCGMLWLTQSCNLVP